MFFVKFRLQKSVPKFPGQLCCKKRGGKRDGKIKELWLLIRYFIVRNLGNR